MTPSWKPLWPRCSKALDPAAEPDVLTYIEQLRAVQAGARDSAQCHGRRFRLQREAVLRFALGWLNPKPEDQWLDVADDPAAPASPCGC